MIYFLNLLNCKKSKNLKPNNLNNKTVVITGTSEAIAVAIDFYLRFHFHSKFLLNSKYKFAE